MSTFGSDSVQGESHSLHDGAVASRGDAFGVYIHIPFCAARCDYCAFATWTDRHHLTDAYLRAVRAEIERGFADALPVASTVFVGGGTPSQVPAEQLAAVISAVPVEAQAEVTVECNPDDVTPQLIGTLMAAGVNRVSLGVQSMSAHVLASLGRTHDPAAVQRAVATLRAAGISSFNLDLIYGGVGESLDDWAATVSGALALDPPHVSAYALTVEPGTPLASDSDRHPDDDDQADKYDLADDLLIAAGLANYEVSNWARPGHESRHNQLYWAQGDYRGFGCAAHSHEAGRRWWNLRTPERYIAAVEAGRSTLAAEERLSEPDRALEGLQLALRTRHGVPAAALHADDHERLSGLLEPHPSDAARVVLSRPGRLLANEVAVRLTTPDSENRSAS